LGALSLFDVFSYADLVLAAMLYMMPPPVPEALSLFHISVLAWKGLAGVWPLFNLIPRFIGPVFFPIAVVVDIVSASLVMLSQQPFWLLTKKS
jgi:hypothetical protein